MGLRESLSQRKRAPWPMRNNMIGVTRGDRSASRGRRRDPSAGRQIVVNDEGSDGYWQGMTAGRVIGLLIGVLSGPLAMLIGRGHETARALAVRP